MVHVRHRYAAAAALESRGEQLWRLDPRTGVETRTSLDAAHAEGERQGAEPPSKRARGSRCAYLCWSTGELMDRHCYLVTPNAPSHSLE